MFGTEEVETERVRAKGQQLMDVNVRQALVGRWFIMVLGVIESVGPALVFAFGGLLVMRGELGLGTVVAFVALIGKLYGPASSLAGVHVDLVTSYAYFERVFAVLDLEPEIRDLPGAELLRHCRGAVAFRGVSFAYPGSAATLTDVSFEVQPGQTLALVGPSGAGKSTMAALLPRLHEVTAGQVLVDGRDVRSLTLASLRSQIAVVQQETSLFHGTIEENLRYGRPDASVEQIRAAARAAHIHDVVASLPEGYQTVVGDPWPPAFGRRAAAGRDRPGAPARSTDLDPGRGDVKPRQPLRGQGAGGVPAAPRGPDVDRRGAPALDRGRCRPDRRARARPRRRARHPPPAAGRRRPVRTAL